MSPETRSNLAQFLGAASILLACGGSPNVEEGGAGPAESGACAAEAENCDDSASTAGSQSGASLSGSVLTGAPELTFSPPAGTFLGQVAVAMATPRPNAIIRHTLDRTPVTANSPEYVGALDLSASTEVRARVFVDGSPVGHEHVVPYVARDFDLTVDLPVVVLDSYGAPAPDPETMGGFGAPVPPPREYIDAALMTFETPGGALSDTPAVASRASFRLRGQSTAMFEKSPYRIELRDGEDQDVDAPLLALPEESDWTLRGPFADKSLIRDAFFYGLGAEMGMKAPRFAYCEVYRNTGGGPLSADDYQGVYLVVETIKNSKNRLDLKQLDATDIAPEQLSGGYIFKFEWMNSEEPTIPCTGLEHCWTDLEVHDPAHLTGAQASWLRGHITDFVRALYSPKFDDPESGYAAYIDVDSFIDQLIVNELGREMDSYLRSAYFHKERDGKIFAGPLWDYNLTLSLGGFFENDSVEGFQYEQTREDMPNEWFPRLMEDPAFVARLASRWQELRQGLLTNAAIDARIDSLTAPLSSAALRNFDRWPNLTEPMVGPFNTPTAATWQGQVEVVRTWAKARAAWLDTVWR